MKVLRVLQARVIWLFDTGLINPRGLSMRDLFAVIKDRYQFAKAPLHELDYTGTDKRTLVFEGGVFDVEGSAISISFTVYNDGIVAISYSDTASTTLFLRDLRGFVAEFGFSIPDEDSIQIGYVSTLDIESSANMLSLFPEMQPIVQFIQSHLSSLDGKPREFQFAQIGIWSEDLSKNHAPVAFKFERRVDQNFSQNRYWSQAPLQTKDHYELLNMLDQLLSR